MVCNTARACVLLRAPRARGSRCEQQTTSILGCSTGRRSWSSQEAIERVCHFFDGSSVPASRGGCWSVVHRHFPRLRIEQAVQVVARVPDSVSALHKEAGSWINNNGRRVRIATLCRGYDDNAMGQRRSTTTTVAQGATTRQQQKANSATATYIADTRIVVVAALLGFKDVFPRLRICPRLNGRPGLRGGGCLVGLLLLLGRALRLRACVPAQYARSMGGWVCE